MEKVLAHISSSLDLFNSVLDEWKHYFPPERPQDKDWYNESFKFLHARNIRDLTSDILFMYQNKRLRGLRMCARPLVESFFNLCASYNSSLVDYPLTKASDEFREQEKRVKQWNSLYQGTGPEAASGAALLVQTEAHLKELINRYGAIPELDWSTYNVALKTRYPNQYRAAYYTYSLWTHCNIVTLATLDDIEEANGTMKAVAGFAMISLGEIYHNQPFADPDKLFQPYENIQERWPEVLAS